MEALEPEDPRRTGDYVLLRRLGAGGMGRVYLGRTAGGRTVAVKTVRAEFAADQDFRDRFRREVAAARLVGDRWTAPVLDADTEGPRPWVATGYLPGPDLARALEEFGPLPTSAVRTLGAGLAEALRTMHGLNLVHRDVKPSNVLLTLDGPRLIDFGITRALDATTALTRTGLIVGSPGCFAPEQARCEAVGPAGDVFSLGVVLAYAATGRMPFGDSPSAAVLLYRVLHEPPDLDAVPAGLRDLTAACLAKDPADRPSATAVRDRLATPDPRTAHATSGGGWLPPRMSEALARRAVDLLHLDADADVGVGADAEAGAGPGADAGAGSGAGPGAEAGAASRANADAGADLGTGHGPGPGHAPWPAFGPPAVFGAAAYGPPPAYGPAAHGEVPGSHYNSGAGVHPPLGPGGRTGTDARTGQHGRAGLDARTEPDPRPGEPDTRTQPETPTAPEKQSAPKKQSAPEKRLAPEKRSARVKRASALVIGLAVCGAGLGWWLSPGRPGTPHAGPTGSSRRLSGGEVRAGSAAPSGSTPASKNAPPSGNVPLAGRTVPSGGAAVPNPPAGDISAGYLGTWSGSVGDGDTSSPLRITIAQGSVGDPVGRIDSPGSDDGCRLTAYLVSADPSHLVLRPPPGDEGDDDCDDVTGSDDDPAEHFTLRGSRLHLAVDDATADLVRQR